MSAPGVNITGASSANDAATVTEDGTSMATPLVSGVAALVLDQNPALGVAQVYALLNAWATPGVITGATNVGGGKNLLYSLIQWDQQPDVTPSPSPTPSPFVPPPPIRNSGATLAATPLLLVVAVAYVLTFIKT
jgi:subtilisin family serine protease